MLIEEEEEEADASEMAVDESADIPTRAISAATLDDAGRLSTVEVYTVEDMDLRAE